VANFRGVSRSIREAILTDGQGIDGPTIFLKAGDEGQRK
jgi:hypothetical protein